MPANGTAPAPSPAINAPAKVNVAQALSPHTPYLGPHSGSFRNPYANNADPTHIINPASIHGARIINTIPPNINAIAASFDAPHTSLPHAINENIKNIAWTTGANIKTRVNLISFVPIPWVG